MGKNVLIKLVIALILGNKTFDYRVNKNLSKIVSSTNAFIIECCLLLNFDFG